MKRGYVHFRGLKWNKAAFMRTKFILYFLKQIDSMLPCICLVIDHRKVTHSAIPPFLFLLQLWRHLWSITEQTHSNIESICWFYAGGVVTFVIDFPTEDFYSKITSVRRVLNWTSG